jgi:hypothetical protein
MTKALEVGEFVPPEGRSWSTAGALPARDLCRALSKTASFLQAVEPHGAELLRYEDWWEHDGLHFHRGTVTFPDLFRMVESPRSLLAAVPDEEHVFVGVAPATGRWYLRFRVYWDAPGEQLFGRFGLVLPDVLAAGYRSEVVEPLSLEVVEEDAAEYYRSVRV